MSNRASSILWLSIAGLVGIAAIAGLAILVRTTDRHEFEELEFDIDEIGDESASD